MFELGEDPGECLFEVVWRILEVAEAAADEGKVFCDCLK